LRAAAIGIGSNSLRMLVADIEDAQLHRVLRDREGLRVFAALGANGDISESMMGKACESVNAMVTRARENGAQEIHLFATSAVRDARNQMELSDRLRAATGLPLEICTGETEAKLSFLGATGAQRSGVIDIGGGSTEIVIGQGETLEYADSLQMGAVRLSREAPIRTVKEAYAAVGRAAAILAPHKAEILALKAPSEWVGVGGTFTTSAALVQDVHWKDRGSIHGFVATRGQITEIMERLAVMSLRERMGLKGMQTQRADIIVHGLTILLCCMQELHIDQITVSENGNLEGYLKMKYLMVANR
jgi:exopolyphosphatase / guanosine-5'-triphosphate,3'-diphosphate pyrophosphatase